MKYLSEMFLDLIQDDFTDSNVMQALETINQEILRRKKRCRGYESLEIIEHDYEEMKALWNVTKEFSHLFSYHKREDSNSFLDSSRNV